MLPAYATPAGRALLDRRLYLPEHTWLADSDRCHAAGVPDEVGFAIKPALAIQMLLAALEAGVQALWVSGDEVYGQDPRLRAALQERRMGYVLAIAGNRRVNLESEAGERGPGRSASRGSAPAPLQRRGGRPGPALLPVGLGPHRRRPAGWRSAAIRSPGSWPSTAATRPPDSR
ncbi:hypothetical protein Skr01_76080 [Sphaerisporangium krabiense]|nr:hypothetical protein Skr01_76080 [Sphaerisporangium krabiense]